MTMSTWKHLSLEIGTEGQASYLQTLLKSLSLRKRKSPTHGSSWKIYSLTSQHWIPRSLRKILPLPLLSWNGHNKLWRYFVDTKCPKKLSSFLTKLKVSRIERQILRFERHSTPLTTRVLKKLTFACLVRALHGSGRKAESATTWTSTFWRSRKW